MDASSSSTPTNQQKTSHANTLGRPLATALDRLPKHADVDEHVLGNAFLISPNACFITDWNGVVLVHNRRAERSFLSRLGQEAPNVRGQHLSQLTTLSQEETTRALRDAAAAGTLSLPLTGTGGRTSPHSIMFRISLLKSATRGERLLLLTQDQLKPTITALHSMNARRQERVHELHKAKQQSLNLQETIMTMEAFASAAAHDLRTPLSTLKGSLEIISSHFADQMPAQAVEFLETMQNAARQMEALTTELLDHALSTARAPQFQNVCLRDTLGQVQFDLADEIKLSGARIRLEGEEARIHADPMLLRLLLNNLISNAIKYRCADCDLEIDIKCEISSLSRWMISVADNGLGFDPAEATNIMRPFHRAHSEIEGTGIGLSTCAEICRRHQWSFEATSEPTKGSIFYISFGTPTESWEF